jgi:hypothetical protein
MSLPINNQFTIEVKLCDQRLHDVLTSGIEGGCAYWASIDCGAHQPGWSNYFTATFFPHGDTAIPRVGHTLSLEKLRCGLAIMANKYPFHFRDVMMETDDATTGDVLVQCALFGEIVYC